MEYTHLPEAEVLADLRRRGLTYREIAERYGVVHGTIIYRLKRAGLHRPEFQRLKQAEIEPTIVALVRQGVSSMTIISRILDAPKSTAFYWVKKLMGRGLLANTPNCDATLRATEKGKNYAPLVVVCRKDENGALVKVDG